MKCARQKTSQYSLATVFTLNSMRYYVIRGESRQIQRLACLPSVLGVKRLKYFP